MKLRELAKKHPLARGALKAGRKVNPVVEAAAGIGLMLIPFPEPVTEVSSDIAGIAMIGDAIRRIRRGKR